MSALSNAFIPSTLEKQVGWEGEQCRPPRTRLLMAKPPNVRRDILPQRLHHRRQDRQARHQRRITTYRDDQHVKPVREPMGSQEDTHGGAERPEDEAVDEIYSEDVREYVLEEFEGEEFLHCRRELDDGLETDAEEEAV